MICAARAYDDEQQPAMPVECELPAGHAGPHRSGPFAWPNTEDLEQVLATERSRHEAAAARERVLRAALAVFEGVPRCLVCAASPVPVPGATCSPECAARAPSAVPDPVRDAPTRAVPLCARDTLIFDADPLGVPETVEAEQAKTITPMREREGTVQMWRVRGD